MISSNTPVPTLDIPSKACPNASYSHFPLTFSLGRKLHRLKKGTLSQPSSLLFVSSWGNIMITLSETNLTGRRVCLEFRSAYFTVCGMILRRGLHCVMFRAVNVSLYGDILSVDAGSDALSDGFSTGPHQSFPFLLWSCATL